MNNKIIKVIQEVHEQFKARGNWGHSGRLGKRGGSAPKGGGGKSSVVSNSYGISESMIKPGVDVWVEQNVSTGQGYRGTVQSYDDGLAKLKKTSTGQTATAPFSIIAKVYD